MRKSVIAILSALFLYNVYALFLAPGPVYQDHQVIVATGDSLWGIAARYAAPGEDVREVVFRIAKASKLRDKTLRPGQVLQVPLHVAADLQLAAK